MSIEILASKLPDAMGTYTHALVMTLIHVTAR